MEDGLPFGLTRRLTRDAFHGMDPEPFHIQNHPFFNRQEVVVMVVVIRVLVVVVARKR